MNGEHYFAKGPISSIYYIKINQDMNRDVFFSCGPIFSEVCILIFRQDHVMLTLHQLIKVRNDILIQSKDFITKWRKWNSTGCFFSLLVLNRTCITPGKASNKENLAKRQIYHQFWGQIHVPQFFKVIDEFCLEQGFSDGCSTGLISKIINQIKSSLKRHLA